jgi:hypothetical protein
MGKVILGFPPSAGVFIGNEKLHKIDAMLLFDDRWPEQCQVAVKTMHVLQ